MAQLRQKSDQLSVYAKRVQRAIQFHLPKFGESPRILLDPNEISSLPKISIGDQYQYSSGVWDGEPDDYKQCLGCGEIFDAVTRDGGEVGFTQLRDFLFDSDCDHADERAVFAKNIGVDADAIARLMGLEVSS